MKKLLYILALCLMSVSFTKCEKAVECDGINTKRIGAVCKDGTRSNATGSGACSNHGGVNYWLCN